ncbi:MAG: 50S ribosomal protein L20, partial [Candidatus Riesia sp.]|nr:50S ribosomal protein L20 [Candidatus Riesia sp.]
RTNRQKWIITINAALKDKNIKYNTFIKALNLKNIQINRKIMYMLIKNNITLFNTIIENTCT